MYYCQFISSSFSFLLLLNIIIKINNHSNIEFLSSSKYMKSSKSFLFTKKKENRNKILTKHFLKGNERPHRP